MCRIRAGANLHARRIDLLHSIHREPCQGSFSVNESIGQFDIERVQAEGLFSYFVYPPILPWTFHSEKLPELSWNPRIPRFDGNQSGLT